MSWRRFSVLLRGLPPWGAAARMLPQEKNSQLQADEFFSRSTLCGLWPPY